MNQSSKITTCFAVAGLALSLFLALFKLAALPCGGGCEKVIYSSYGELWGVPLGAYGAALWLGVFFAPGKRSRLLCQGVLAAGSVGLVAVQAFVLRAFCPYCLTHALLTWGALFIWKTPPWKPGIGISLALAGAVWLGAGLHARLPGPVSAAVLLTQSPARNAGCEWLGEAGPASPAVVLSVDCPACRDKMAALTAFDFAQRKSGPLLYWRMEVANRELTIVLVAAVLSQPGDRREAFLAAMALLLAQQDLVLTDPKSAAAVLRATFPATGPYEKEAVILLDRQAEWLRVARVEITPLLITPAGGALTKFAVAEMFPAQPIDPSDKITR